LHPFSNFLPFTSHQLVASHLGLIFVGPLGDASRPAIGNQG
jgi:hypothetical protein